MAIYKCTLAKEVDGVIEYLYPKSTADLIEYAKTTTNNSGSTVIVGVTVQDELDSINNDLDSITNNFTNLVDVTLPTNYYTKEQIREIISYKAIAFNSASINPVNAESGDSVNAVIAWDLNKIPASMTLNGSVLTPSANGSNTRNAVTASTTYTISATEPAPLARTAVTVTKNVSITFSQYSYYGVGAIDSIPTAANMDSKVSADGQFTVFAGTDQYIYYLCPTNVVPTFYVGGFAGGFDLINGSYNFTNRVGKVMAYRVYRSNNPNLGVTTVDVNSIKIGNLQ